MSWTVCTAELPDGMTLGEVRGVLGELWATGMGKKLPDNGGNAALIEEGARLYAQSDDAMFPSTASIVEEWAKARGIKAKRRTVR